MDELPKCTLIIIDGGPQGQEFPLTGTQLTVGRLPANDICLSWDPRVSRHHARLLRQDGTWVIEDVGSTNGTFLETDRLHGPTPLANGSRIRAGRIWLELKVDAVEADAHGAPPDHILAATPVPDGAPAVSQYETPAFPDAPGLNAQWDEPDSNQWMPNYNAPQDTGPPLMSYPQRQQPVDVLTEQPTDEDGEPGLEGADGGEQAIPWGPAPAPAGEAQAEAAAPGTKLPRRGLVARLLASLGLAATPGPHPSATDAQPVDAWAPDATPGPDAGATTGAPAEPAAGPVLPELSSTATGLQVRIRAIAADPTQPPDTSFVKQILAELEPPAHMSAQLSQTLGSADVCISLTAPPGSQRDLLAFAGQLVARLAQDRAYHDLLVTPLAEG